MSLSPRVQNFGFHNVVVYNPNTLETYGQADVVASVDVARTKELINQTGGSYADPTASELGAATVEGSLVFRQLEDWMPEVFMGNAATINAAETGGYVSTITNGNGTSLVDATTGIASIGIKAGSEAKLVTGKYFAKVISPITVQVYPLNSSGFYKERVSYAGDNLAINTTPFTITAGATTEIVDDKAKPLGLELTGGSGIIAMTIGDTAEFEVRAINNGSYETSIGGLYEHTPEIGLIFNGGLASNGTTSMLQLYRCVATGIPFNMTEKAFLETTITFTPKADACNDGEIGKFIQIKPDSSCG